MHECKYGYKLCDTVRKLIHVCLYVFMYMYVSMLTNVCMYVCINTWIRPGLLYLLLYNHFSKSKCWNNNKMLHETL